MKITTETIKRYYVEQNGLIYGGPFDTREEASACLKGYHARRITIHCTQWGNWYGYVNGKKVKAFFATPEHDQQANAEAWLEAQRLFREPTA